MLYYEVRSDDISIYIYIYYILYNLRYYIIIILYNLRYDEETHQVSELRDTEIEIQNAVRGIVPLEKMLFRHIRTFQKDWIAACRHKFSIALFF